MAGQGVVNIGLNVDYQKSLNAMIQEFKTTLNKISSELKKTELTVNLEAQIAELAKTTQAEFDKINNGKLDAKSFEEFRVKAEGQLSNLDTDVKNLQKSLDNLDASSVTYKISRQFKKLKNDIKSSFEGISDVVNIVDKINAHIDQQSLVNGYEAALKAIKSCEKEYLRVYDGSNPKAVKTDKTSSALENEIKAKIREYRDLKEDYENILNSIPDKNVDSLTTNQQIEKGLIKLQAEISETATKIVGLREEIKSLGNEKINIPSIDMGIVNRDAVSFDANILGVLNKRKKELSDSIKKATANVDTFKLKDGAIQVPIDFATNTGELESKLQELISVLQNYSQSNPVKINVALNEINEDVSSILAPLKEALENTPISIRINKDEIANEIKESVKSTASEPSTYGKEVKSATKANKSLETQAEKTSTAIENEAKTAQSASEKFRKLAKEKGNATIANRELAKAAKETADALEREAKARKEAESSRGSKNAVDSSTYSANALEWQRKIKQELLDSGNYAEVYNAKISQTTKGNVSFASSVQTMDGEWKSFTATLDNSGNIVSSKLKDLNEKQVASIERAKEQARQLMEAYMAMASGESNESTSYNRSQMENLITETVEAIQALEGLDAKYKAVLNDDGSVTITKSLTEASGTVKTFTANFENIQTVIKAANDSVEEFRSVLESAFDSAKVSVSTKGAKAETPKVDTSSIDSVTSKYKEIYEVAKKLNSLELKLAGLDAEKNANQIDVLNSELKQTEEIYSRLITEFWDEKSVGNLPIEDFKELNSVFEETTKKISEIKAKLADNFVRQGNSEISKFESKYGESEDFSSINARLQEIKASALEISDAPGLEKIKEELRGLAETLDYLNRQRQATDLLNDLVENNKNNDNYKLIADDIKSLSEAIRDIETPKQLEDFINKIKELSKGMEGVEKYQDSANKALLNFKVKNEGNANYAQIKAELDDLKTAADNVGNSEGLIRFKQQLSDLQKKLNNIGKDNKLGKKLGEQSFGNINEVRANIDSLFASIGKVNEKSIRVSGADKLTAEVKVANGEIHKMTVNLDSRGFARYVDGGIAEFKRLGSAAEGVFKGIKDLVRIYLSPQDFIQYFRQGLDTITELDTALTELIKVSDASDNEIANYFDEAVGSAKELGTSVKDMISATADWKRNGYSLPDSKKLAETAILYKNVGDGIDIDDATSSIISTLQGFQLEADEAEGIVDKFNAVSNAFSIESGGIGDALQRSAAAFNAANTDLSQSTALVTATNEVLQNPEKVGTLFTTLSARIRGKVCAHYTVMCRPLYEDKILVA